MKRITVLAMVLLVGLLIGLGRVPQAQAGIFNADSEVTYKEYWMDHSQFTAGCVEGGLPEKPGGSWYVEPGKLDQCPKAMQITLPDNFASAIKAEIYLDLWRNYDPPSARFRINGSPTVYTPSRGYDWSRTPWVSEIPLNDLIQGTNTFTFWAEYGPYHIHDIAIRLYYDDVNPLVGGPGSDVTPPDGELLSITSLDDAVEVPAYTGGLLLVNNDQLTFKANVQAGAKYVEFHAYYDGYDDDNDGEFQDWHNVGRNNWWPGGKEAVPNGGTINHIGTKTVPGGGGDITQVWDLKHVVNQSEVKFKIRIVDAAGNVREAAGGVTPEYTLARYYPAFYTMMPDFENVGLHMSGSQPPTETFNYPLPATYNAANYSEVYLVGMYWKKPRYSFNGLKPASVNPAPDDWVLGIQTVSKSVLQPGNNSLVYSYSGSGVGQFVEEPGPMLVFKGLKTAVADVGLPYIISRQPAANAVNVDIFTSINVGLGDLGSGVDKNSVVMSVNGELVQPVFSGPSNDLMVSYIPTQPLPSDTVIPVTVYGCDLLGNCMTSADLFSFTTEPPDVTPPVISDILVNTTDTSATIHWTTNETADSKVEYGLTQALEKPSVSDTPLITQHTLELTGLQNESTYYFKLTSKDYNGNPGSTGILTFKTKRAPGDILSDDFSACQIDTAVWSFLNPVGDATLAMTGAGAQISVPANTRHDIWRSNVDSPRLMQFVTNQDFDIEVKFENPITKKTQSMGVLALQDDINYLRFNFQDEGNGVTTLAVVNTFNGASQVVFSTPVTITGATWMRINRAGDIWNVQYSMDGTNFTFATSYSRTLILSQIGPFVGNTGTNPAHVNIIDYFENLEDPLEGDDPLIELTVVTDGEGTVTRAPDKSGYTCNETVTLTADPENDWGFSGWSGGITSSNLVETITLTQSEVVTATFFNTTPYTLDVTVVNQGPGVGGTVTKDPEQATYFYGDEVELTAAPTPGWSFLGWTGDWSGTDLVTVVPVTGDMDVIATFDQDEYTLETLIITEGIGSGGSITVEPVQPTYLYGDVVTITLTVDEGWTFVGWEGEGVSGTDLVLSFPMSQDVVAIARLVQNQYDLTTVVESIGEPGAIGGFINKLPDQTTYGHGQVVTVTAAAELGWLFTGWAGDLTGANPTESLTMTDDRAITATFTQQQYTVTVTVMTPDFGSVTISPQKPYYLYGDIVTLTPDPEPGYDFSSWAGDLSGTIEPAVFAVDKDFDIEAFFEVDTTPIEILEYDVEVLPGGTLARVTWTTDVPGTSRVDYGESELYEGGTVQETDLVTEHELVLTGLTPETFYHFKIISVDAFDNPVESEDLTFSTSSSSGIFSDDFSACELDNRWSWLDPLNDSSYMMNGRQVEISVPAGTTHNVWSTGIDAPRLMQPSNDTDFTIEVKFDSDLPAPVSIQGVIIEQDAQNFLRFDFYKRSDPAQPQEINVYAATFENLAPRQRVNARVAEVPAPMYMRVVRSGDRWEQWYKLGEGDWVKNVEFTFALEVKRAGVFAGNTPYKGVVPGHTALVDYFFNTASPIDPEDSRFALDIDIEGSGSVARDPDRSGYYCGQEVTLTATPATGWIFFGWTGDATGTNPNRKVTVTHDMAITAVFVQAGQGFRIALPVILK